MILDLFALSDTQYRGLQLLAYILFTLLVGLGIGRWVINRLNYMFSRGYGRIVFSRNNLKPTGDGRFLLQLRNLLEEISLDRVVLDPIFRERVVAAGKRCSEKHPFPVLSTDDEQQAWLDANLGFISRVNAAGELAESLGLPVVTKWVWLVPACADGARGTIAKFRTIWIGVETVRNCSDDELFDYERPYHETRGNTLKMIYDAVTNHDGRIDYYGRKVRIAVQMEVKAPAIITEELLRLLASKSAA
ncbi:MAG: hypothetical protein RIQ56_755 [Candidatus Parcubacteria bacterium]